MTITSNAPPLVSIVMSVFNDDKRLVRSIDSICQQTFQGWELIVIDDGSTDDSLDRIESIAKIEPRIRVVTQSNSGLTKALIRGCSEARGEYIARQDSDDWSHPTRLAKQSLFLREHPDIGFVSCWTDYLGPNNELLQTVKRPSASHEATELLLHGRTGPPAHGSVMFRRDLYEFVGGYRSEFYFGQDSDLWMRMAERVPIAYFQETLYSALRSPHSISGSARSIQRRFGELGQACRAARVAGCSESEPLREAAALTEEIRTNLDERSSRKNDISNMEYLIGSQLMSNGDPRATQYLWSVVKHRPWHLKAWIKLSQALLANGPNKWRQRRP